MDNTQAEQRSALSEIIKERLQDPKSIKTLDPLTKETIKDRKSDRGLKERYGCWIWICVVQLLIANIIFIAVGLTKLVYEQWVLELYMSGTLAEVFGIVFVITRHLFPVRDKN